MCLLLVPDVALTCNYFLSIKLSKYWHWYAHGSSDSQSNCQSLNFWWEN